MELEALDWLALICVVLGVSSGFGLLFIHAKQYQNQDQDQDQEDETTKGR